MLDQELKAYQAIKGKVPAGQFVLIHGEDLVGVFETEAEAFGEGARQFGRGPFLIRQVRVMGAALKAQNLIALIGRDALAGSVLFYNGPVGEVTLVLP
jgi:hypothetical protein